MEFVAGVGWYEGEYKKGKFSKPSVKTIANWWVMFAVLSAIVTYVILQIIFT